MAKDLIIGAFNNYTEYSVLKPWVQSIKDTGFKGDIVLIAIGTTEELCRTLVNEGVYVIAVNEKSNMMIHMLRFVYIYDFLKNSKDTYRFVVSTDVRDVIFQKDPTLFLEKKLHGALTTKLISSSEVIKIKDEEWNKENIRKNFGDYFYTDVQDNHVCNVGILAGYADAVRDLCFYLYQFSLNRPDWVADQAAYNMLLGYNPWKNITEVTTLKDAWAANVHVTNKPDLIEKLEPYLLETRPHMNDEGFICNDDKEPFTIVHQYDRVPEWMEHFSKKYGINITAETNTGTSPKYFLYKS